MSLFTQKRRRIIQEAKLSTSFVSVSSSNKAENIFDFTQLKSALASSTCTGLSGCENKHEISSGLQFCFWCPQSDKSPNLWTDQRSKQQTAQELE